MNLSSVRWLAVTMTLAGAVASLDAKGATVKLTISGGLLGEPVEITDRPLLADSNVYQGTFIGPTTAPPEPRLARYTVSFYVETPAGMKEAVRVRYVVSYATDVHTDEGFIYLPARGEPGYAVNAGTIERDAAEGQWHRAPKAWASDTERSR